MAIPLSHFFCLVPHPLVNQPLVNSFCSTVRCEGMTKDVPSKELFPIAPVHSPPEVMGSQLGRKGLSWLLADRELSARMLGKPLPHYFL